MNSKDFKLKVLKQPSESVCYLDHKDTVIGICTYNGEFLLINQLRPIFKDNFWEFPGGSIEVNESGDEAVKREIQEETGVQVDQGRKLIEFIPSIGTSNETISVYHFSLNSNPIGKTTNNCRLFSLKELDSEFSKDQLLDGKTYLAFLYYLRNTPS
ncbi:NUDIX hydrolase [Roseivirga sp.]|uniref:NUDIX hydrolase n=1 Tax=Roseivirga sp. TaxID=1964215 RepID=UPI002B26BF13|nr:NUDIX hydrolase [Roseivirga sp.]